MYEFLKIFQRCIITDGPHACTNVNALIKIYKCKAHFISIRFVNANSLLCCTECDGVYDSSALGFPMKLKRWIGLFHGSPTWCWWISWIVSTLQRNIFYFIALFFSFLRQITITPLTRTGSCIYFLSFFFILMYVKFSHMYSYILLFFGNVFTK